MRCQSDLLDQRDQSAVGGVVLESAAPEEASERFRTVGIAEDQIAAEGRALARGDRS